MEYIRFGSTGLNVSRLGLGRMSHGRLHLRWTWALNDVDSRQSIQRMTEEIRSLEAPCHPRPVMAHA
jgi:aryl-alcohol dehydrogenase-like predicted oxidoreductase